MKDEITLVLTKECFDTLDTESDEFGKQFTDIEDCPIARAFQRQFPDIGMNVSPCRIRTSSHERYFHNNHYLLGSQCIDIHSIERVAEKLKTQSKVMLKFHKV